MFSGHKIVELTNVEIILNLPSTVIVNEQLASFEAASVAVHVTVVTPIGNSSPETSPPSATHTMVGAAPELS